MRLGLTKVAQDLFEFSERKKRLSKVKPQIDGLLQRVASLRKVLEGSERLFEEDHRLPIGRAGHGFVSSLAAVAQRLVPALSSLGVVGQALDVLGKSVGIERLDGGDDARVQRLAAFLEKAAVGHLMGQGVLERVLQRREQARFVEEFRRLKMGQGRRLRSSSVKDRALAAPAVSTVIARSRANGTSLPITAAVWSSRFSSAGSRSMRAAKTAWTVAGTRMPATSAASR